MAVQSPRDDIRAAMLVIPVSLQLDAVGYCFSLIACRNRNNNNNSYRTKVTTCEFWFFSWFHFPRLNFLGGFLRGGNKLV